VELKINILNVSPSQYNETVKKLIEDSILKSSPGAIRVYISDPIFLNTTNNLRRLHQSSSIEFNATVVYPNQTSAQQAASTNLSPTNLSPVLESVGLLVYVSEPIVVNSGPTPLKRE
jgi:hypothetical protein